MAIQLSLIIPIYRQEKTILADVHEILSALQKTRFTYEVICVIDGHVDNSAEILLNAGYPCTKIISYDKNHGKSYAIRYGMKHAVGEYVMFLDSGREIDTSGISMLMEHMIWYDADVIVGSKRHPVSKVSYTLLRRVLSVGYYFIVKILFRISVRDTQAGIKVFKRKVLEDILPRLLEKKYCGDLEMLVVARSRGFKRIFEAPIELRYNLGSITSAATLKSIAHMLVDTMAIWYRLQLTKTYK